MNGLNQINIIGNVVRDAELTTVNVGGVQTPRCKFSVAVNEPSTNDEDITTYFDVTTWREYATKTAPWILKGRQVCVTGAVRLNTYTSGGITRSTMQIHNAAVILLGKKPEVDVGNIEEVDEDELPFG